MRRCAALVFLLLSTAPVGAQVIPVYGVLRRPAGVRYEVLRSRHFEVIHQAGTSRTAAELARVLEASIPAVSELLPVRDDFRMPVVLSSYSDRGNGYVSPMPFRQEIDASPFTGPGVSARHASWLETVAPHELVHAVHADTRAGFGVGGIVNLFAPDMARAMDLWVPPGIAEGAAIFVESRMAEGAGRLNWGYYRMQYRAAAGSGHPWGLAQALEWSGHTRPTDRHYIGGGPFVDWFVKEYGVETFRRLARVHDRFPLFGYGFSLWIASGRPPWAIGRAFRQHALEEERAFRDYHDLHEEVAPLSGRKGMVHRRPRWLDGSTLVVYMTAYDRERGLYSVDVETGRLEALSHQELDSGLRFSVNHRKSAVLFGRYLQDPFTPVRQEADLFELSTETGRVEKVTRGLHAVAPAALPQGGILAVEAGPRGNAIFRVEEDGRVTRLVADDHLRLVDLDVDPETGRVLVVANRYGVQAVWELRMDGIPGPGVEFLLGVRAGAVLDASWVPGADRIVFSADVGGKLDVYVHDLPTGHTWRLTHSVYGAMEPSVSPDGVRLAYVRYGSERFDLVVEPFRPEGGEPVTESALLDPAELPDPPVAVTGPDPWEDAAPAPYRASRGLRPRMVYPMLYVENAPGVGPDADLGLGGGLAVQGADPLLTWSWWGEGFLRRGRPWGELGLMTSAILPMPVLRLYDRPDAVTVLAVPGDGSAPTPLRVIREERGAALGLRFPVALSNNVRSSTLSVGSDIRYAQRRLFDDRMQPLTGFDGRLTAAGSVQMGLSVQRNLRDLVPSRGLFLAVAGEADLAAKALGRDRAAIVSTAVFVPWLSRMNTGIRLDLAWVVQSDRSVLDLDWFMPRGQQNRLPESRSLLRMGAETVIPLAFPDGGLLILPLYVSAVYVYGFGETVVEAGVLAGSSTFADAERYSSFGGGMGARVRLFHVLDLDLRIGAARREGESGWTTIYR